MEQNDGPRDGFFENTVWSTVLKAKEGSEQTRWAALDRLLGRYRRPIILEIRQRKRCNELEAEELAHQFIHDWLRRNFLKGVNQNAGRFRAFVKTCIVNFLRDAHAMETAEKRGGGEKAVSLDVTDDEGRRLLDPPDRAANLELEADRAWAIQVLNEALIALENECIAARRGSLFTALKSSLGGDPSAEAYSAIAARLGMNDGAVRVAVHRLRKRLGELIEDEVKQTVGGYDDWREELRYLIALVGR